MKVRTNEHLVVFLISFTVFTAAALTVTASVTTISCTAAGHLRPAQALAQAAAGPHSSRVAAIAASMMTSGQFLGVLFAMLLGVLILTNEFAHQTATATFMTVPRRAVVVMARLAAAACCRALFWVVSTIIDRVTMPITCTVGIVSTRLTGWIVIRAVLLNLSRSSCRPSSGWALAR